MKIRPMRKRDVGYVAKNLRSADLAELQAVAGYGDKEAIKEILMSGMDGAEALTIEGPSGKPCAILGLFPAPQFNVVWLVGTDEVQQARVFIMRECKRLFPEWYAEYGTLGNAMWEHNKLHREWAIALGFEFTGETFLVGPLWFHRFLYRYAN